MRSREQANRWVAVLIVCLSGLVATTATAETVDGPRHALVIGNAAYGHFGALGFSVSELINASFAQMDEAVFEFGETLAREGGVGLFYYAGHGIEAGGVNYLVPVDQEIRADRELRRKAISVSAVLSEMEYARNGTNIIILDACRDNPLPANARSSGSSRGLSVVQAPSGSLVCTRLPRGRLRPTAVGETVCSPERCWSTSRLPALMR